jgi:hypothetical protein
MSSEPRRTRSRKVGVWRGRARGGQPAGGRAVAPLRDEDGRRWHPWRRHCQIETVAPRAVVDGVLNGLHARGRTQHREACRSQLRRLCTEATAAGGGGEALRKMGRMDGARS